MKILLFGKNGQLGRALVERVEPIGQKETVEILGLNHEQCDITNQSQCAKIMKKSGADVVINATAFHVVPLCEIEYEKAFKVNAFAVGRLAKQCKTLNMRFLTISTDYVFDGTKGTPYTEDDAPHPLQMYGLSKYVGEVAALRENPDSLIIRTCGVYGGGVMGSRAKKGNFALSILKAAQEKSELSVSSEQIVNPTYAGHLAAVLLQFLKKNPPGGVYHLASEGFCSWAEFAEEIVRQKGLPLKIIPVDRGGQDGSLHRPLFSALANTKAKALGIELPPWQEGITDYLKTLTTKA